MKLFKGQKSILQKMIIVTIIIVMLFNVVFPIKSRAAIPVIGDIAQLLVQAAFNFIRFTADIIEGGMQYFFVGGTDSFWVMYKTDSLEQANQYFKDAGYDTQVLYDSLPAEVDASSVIKVQEDQISKWTDYFYNFMSSDTDLSYNIPFLLFTPDNIFSNRIAAFDINFIDPPTNNEGAQQTISSSLRETISNWYNALRMLALAGMLVVLVYVGIRMMISTSATDKAKYKSMLMDWLVAICMLFFLHYIMLFTIRVTESITAMVNSAAGTTWIEVNGEETHYIKTNMMGAVRFQAENNDMYVQAGYTIMYIMLVAYTVIFGIRYLKRVLNVAFLTIISPLIVITYPIDKISDGKAQGFSMWLKDYIFNALLQPLHLILYTILLGSSLSIMVSNNNPIYAIVALAFISQAEKFLKKLFDFDKANGGTVDSMGFAGGALAMGLMSKYSGKVFGKAGGKPGGNVPAEKNPGKELQKTNKGSYGSFLTAGGNNQPQDANNAAENGDNVLKDRTAAGAQINDDKNNTNSLGATDRYNELRAQGLTAEEAATRALLESKENSTQTTEPTTPGLITADDARATVDSSKIDDASIETPQTADSIGITEDFSEPDYANMSTMDIIGQGISNKLSSIPSSAKEGFENFKNMSGREKLSTVGRGLKKAGSIAGKAAPIVGAVAGAATGFALGATTGDLGKAMQGIGIGAGAGAYGARAAGRAITGAAGNVNARAQKAKYSLARSALGYEGAKKWMDAKTDVKQKQEFKKEKENIAYAKDLAAKLGKKDYKEVLDDVYALKSARVNDDKMIEAALTVKDKNKLGQQEMVKLASDTSKRSETMLFGQTESKILVDNLTQSLMSKSNGKLSEKQARSNAARYLENMRAMYNESR